jgi:hypothetical protein
VLAQINSSWIQLPVLPCRLDVERNARTFNGTPRSSVAQLLQAIEDEIAMWTAAGYQHLGALDSLRRAD